MAARDADLPPLGPPSRWAWGFATFQRYAQRYVRRHFHALRLSKTSSPWPTGDDPLLVVLNHPSWWDPLIGLCLAGMLPRHVHYAVIEQAALAKYPFFRRIGFVGVEANSFGGVRQFLRVAEAILQRPRHVLWVTAQGRFMDVRERPLSLRPGVGHLASRLSQGLILPIALEYAFWSERTPEALVRIGEPLALGAAMTPPGRKPADVWREQIEAALTRTLDGLNAETISRDPRQFTVHLSGRSGIGGVYDLWRRAKSWARGQRFDPSHGSEEG